MTRLDRLTKKWALELEALARAFDDPFRWNIECIEILEEIERRITNASTEHADKPSVG